MGPSGEQPPDQRTPPQPMGDSVHLEAHASGEARVNQAARDLHLHYQDGVHGARRVEPGTKVPECPYPGLASFGREQARWFFGRDELTAELTARLDARLPTGGVQVVVAPSGAGKSSLLHAGLLPQLDNGALPGSSRWPRIVFTPTAHPLAALATQITSLIDGDPATVAEELAGGSHRAGAILRRCLGGEDSGARVVVVVDQFEELFTLGTDDQQRRTFIEVLSQLASPRSDTEAGQPVGLVVVGVRADFYTTCANYSHLRTALQDNPLVVGPMSGTELREAIRYPAQNMGLDVEPGLVELLLRDLGDTATPAGESGMTGYEAGRLPLLAHALRATWQQRHGHTLTVEGYRSTGGIHRAVATTAEGVFTGLDPTGQDAARTLFLRLIRIGDRTEDTRRRIARADLLRGLDRNTVVPVVNAFTRGRLLTQEQDTIEITHEALLRAWPRLRQWIDTDRAGNLIRQELDEATAVWDRDRSDTAALYRGNRLEAARTWVTSRSYEGDLSPAASAFLAASTEQERRAVKLRRAVLVVLSVLALVASGAAVFAFQQRATAQSERDTAIFNQITAQADRLRSTDVSLAAQLDLTAYRMRQTPDLYTALVTAGNAALSTPLNGHADSVRAVVFSPDGRTLATGSADRTVRLWNVADPAHPMPLGPPLTGHTSTVRSVVFSPDGRTLATGSADQTVRLWNVADPAHSTPLGPPLTGHTNDVNAVAFSPDGHTLASASSDQTVRLWTVTDPAHPMPLGPPLTGHTNGLDSVAFSPDGHTLASSSADQTVRLWTVADPAHPTPLGQPLTGHTSYVSSVAFSPDGRTLASGSNDNTVRLWNVTDPAHPAPLGPPLTGHTSTVFSVVFSPDGRTLASGGGDHTARLWNIPSALVTGHTDSVSSVVFSPDGRTLASGSADRTVRLWNVADPAHPTPLGPPLTGHTNTVDTVAF
ncbi:MAG: WD40 repeat domain-containing protein, partial [Pseudonocardiaceae bacterium]